MVESVEVATKRIRRGAFLVAAMIAVAAVGCEGNNTGGSSPPPGGSTGGAGGAGGGPYGGGGPVGGGGVPDGGAGGQPSGPTNVNLASTASLGNYLVSADGRTLYYFGLDLPATARVAAVSNCTGSCLAVWPIFHVDTPAPAAGLDASDFAELVRPGGTKQTTYKGWPLYTFSGDSNAGDTNGDDFDGSGGLWFVLKQPFYSVLVMNKTGSVEYLADPAGRTLYFDSQDTAGTASNPPVSTCTGSCLTTWPVFAAANGGTLPTGVDASKVTSFTRPDGMKQSAFDGHPLYYFSGDSAPGQTNGRGFQGIWNLVDPSSL